jgi:hypothetical protein
LIPGLESYALPAAAGGAAGGAAGAASGANPGYSFLGGDATMPGALGANGANMGTGALPGLESYVTGGAGLAGGAAKAANSSLLGKALGVGSTLLGGIAGAQGNDKEGSTTKDVPEWLKPYVTKNLEYAGGLLDKQMQPGYLQGYDDMRSVGQGLLNRPIAGNGFNKFFPGRG